jgi:hypothetical protein
MKFLSYIFILCLYHATALRNCIPPILIHFLRCAVKGSLNHTAEQVLERFYEKKDS